MFIKYSIGQIPLKKSIGKGSQGKKPAVTQVSDESEPEPAHTPKPAKKQSGSKGTRGVVIQDTPRVPQKKSVDHSKKLKGVLMLTLDEQLAADTMQAIKNSQKTIKRQPNTGGSSKGTGITPGVLDDSTVVFPTTHEGTGNKSGVPDVVKVTSKAKLDPILDWGSEHESDNSKEAKINDEDDELIYSDEDKEKKVKDNDNDADDENVIMMRRKTMMKDLMKFILRLEHMMMNIGETVKKVEEEKANDQKEDTTVPNTQHETLDLSPTIYVLSVSHGFG
ncbi:hypothetical protein Tco_0068545, partial [Tanacetum coccineum]